MSAAGSANSPATAAGDTLPESAIEEILALRPKYPTLEALTLPALHIAQRASGGWLPQTIIAAVARLLELLVARVAGVVSFYDMYHVRPVGRHRIRVCTNLSCQLRGSSEILETIAHELGVEEGQVTADGRCSFVQFECLGSCDTAPMVMVDDDYHENLTPERVRQIVRELK